MEHRPVANRAQRKQVSARSLQDHHTHALKENKINCEYKKLATTKSSIKKILKRVRKREIEGINVTIMLDSDAVEDSTKHTEWFQKNGIKVRNIIPTDKDAGEMGFEKVNELLKGAKETSWDDLVLSKLNNI